MEKGQNQEIKSTMHGIDLSKITIRRRDGNTTRIVNNAIDLLFAGHEIECVDHVDNGKNHLCNEILFNNILRRLQGECRITQMGMEIFDHNKLRMKLKQL